MDVVDEWEPIWQPQVRAIVIQGTKELWHQTRFKKANYARQIRERGQFSPYTGHATGAKLRQSTWTHHRSQLGFTLPSQTFMHHKGFIIIFLNNVVIDMVVLLLGKTNKSQRSIPSDKCLCLVLVLTKFQSPKYSTSKCSKLACTVNWLLLVTVVAQ